MRAPARLLLLLLGLCFRALPVACQRLAVSIQTFSRNHHLVESSRDTWRRGVSTLVLTNGSVERRIPSPSDLEVWYEAPDWPAIGWNNPSENRYTAQVRFANQSLDFDWLLSGDDDTIFLMDNVLAMVRDLDPDDAYYITDSLGPDSMKCTIAEEASDRGPGGCLVSPPSRRCTRAVLEAPGVCGHERVKTAPAGEGRIEEPPGNIWGFGQHGFITSRGLLNSVSEADMSGCENCNVTDFCHGAHAGNGTCTGGGCYGGGDVRLGECFWRFAGNRAGIGPTVPYSLAGVRVFGHNMEGVQAHAERVIRGERCDERCRFVLERVLTTDLHHAEPGAYRHAMMAFSTAYGHAKRLLNGERTGRVRPAPPPAAEGAGMQQQQQQQPVAEVAAAAAEVFAEVLAR